MKHLTACSLIITTYNWPHALECCLSSILRQTQLPQEVIIADDGSEPETKNVVDAFAKKASTSFPCLHVWHADQGFRKTIILNKAIAVAAKPYIIQVDGDTILHENFISDHLHFAKVNFFSAGRRAYFTKKATEYLLNNPTKIPSMRDLQERKKGNALRLPWISTLPLFRAYATNSSLKGVLGSTLAYWRADSILINGYNEEMSGWGCEDNEFVVRLLNAGIRRQNLFFSGIQYHLEHPINSRTDATFNNSIYRESLLKKIVACAKGVDQYLSISCPS